MSARPVLLISGANGGLGAATARLFLEQNSEGFAWFGVHERTEEARAIADAFAGRAELIPLTVSDSTAWKRAVATIVERSGRLDILVNNAGGHQDALLGTMSEEAWSSVIDVNLTAVFQACQAALPTMISQRYGRIVNVASLSAMLAPAGQTNYAAAKAGVVAMTQALAKEVARIGITVNAVSPGYIETPALQFKSDEERKATVARVPMRRFARPEEVAAAILFLASPAASYITGANLKVDGGIL